MTKESKKQRTLGSGRDGGKDRRLAASLTPDNKDHNNNDPVDGHSTATARQLSVLPTSCERIRKLMKSRDKSKIYFPVEI